MNPTEPSTVSVAWKRCLAPEERMFQSPEWLVPSGISEARTRRHRQGSRRLTTSLLPRRRERTSPKTSGNNLRDHSRGARVLTERHSTNGVLDFGLPHALRRHLLATTSRPKVGGGRREKSIQFDLSCPSLVLIGLLKESTVIHSPRDPLADLLVALSPLPWEASISIRVRECCE
jgi:hypothetical protein